MKLGNRSLGGGFPTYVIAEVSANHNQSYERAVAIIGAAKAAGADAVKVQTYTADTITIDSDNEFFRVRGTLWDGMTLHRLYSEAYTPWEWQPQLKAVCEELGMDFFSSPFDPTAVTFLESINVCAYKVASPEIVDIPLLRIIGATRKPVILSTGMATLAEIDEAIGTLRAHGTTDLALLKCTSAYPAPPDEMNLRTIPHMLETFGIPVGLSDHSMGHSVAVAAVALGACVVEKHLTMARSEGGADAGFSMEPDEFREMVSAIRTVEAAVGWVSYQPSESEIIPRRYRRSLFAVENIRAGEKITENNVRSIRPGQGLHPRHLDDVLGRRATCDIRKGTPLSWDLVCS